jgi:hypothetical protein
VKDNKRHKEGFGETGPDVGLENWLDHKCLQVTSPHDEAIVPWFNQAGVRSA